MGSGKGNKGMVLEIYRMFRKFLCHFFYNSLGVRVNKKNIERYWENENFNYDAHKTAEMCSSDSDFGCEVIDKTGKKDLKFNNLKGKSFPMFKRVTSGTTGERSEIALDRHDLSHMLSVRDYIFSYYGVSLGSREARVWGTHHDSVFNKMKNFFLNRKVFFPLGNGQDCIAGVRKWDPDYIYGYSSLVMALAKENSIKRMKFDHLKMVVCTAETITRAQKEFIADSFGVPVVEEYGSTEFDVIGFECANGHMHFVNPNIMISRVDGKISLSDPFRRLQDIRSYDLGDDISIEASSCRELGSSMVVSSIRGRSIDMMAISFEGSRFHSVEFAYLIDSYMVDNKEFFDFQVQQNKVGDFLIIVDEGFSGIESDLSWYVKSKIMEKLSLSIEVTVVCNNDFSRDNIKRSYFVQMIDSVCQESA